MAKNRFKPVLSKYGVNASKGLCAYCDEPVFEGGAKWITLFSGKKHMLHASCWKAILVAHRLNPPKRFSSASCSTSNDDEEFNSSSESATVEHYLKKKLYAKENLS